jgi:anti-anti-sigma factor
MYLILGEAMCADELTRPRDPREEDLTALPTAVGVVVEQRGGSTVVAVSGDVDMATAPQLTAALQAACELNPDVLTVDLARVDFLASAGLSALADGAERARGVGASYKVVATEGSVVSRALQLTGLDSAWAVYPSLERALE